jgi:hypothetical protein
MDTRYPRWRIRALTEAGDAARRMRVPFSPWLAVKAIR